MEYKIKLNKQGYQAIFFEAKQITEWSQEYFILDDHYFIQMKDNKCAIFSFDNPNKPITKYFDLIIPELYNDIYVAIEDETKKPFVFSVYSLSKGKLYDVSLPIDTIDNLPAFLHVDERLLIVELLHLRPEVYCFCYPNGKTISYSDYYVNLLDTKFLIKQYIPCGLIPIKTLKHIYLYDINGKLLQDIYLYDDMEDVDIELALEKAI